MSVPVSYEVQPPSVATIDLPLLRRLVRPIRNPRPPITDTRSGHFLQQDIRESESSKYLPPSLSLPRPILSAFTEVLENRPVKDESLPRLPQTIDNHIATVSFIPASVLGHGRSKTKPWRDTSPGSRRKSGDHSSPTAFATRSGATHTR